ncbi:SDR family NAD(P)-dependent oxidoreductase [Brachybacterium saurashtrense]|uniref:SDR family NAD(P)-dependent oxidoreductase n=1 Tax=Brachybacterium saurashtrense TaxID=556288 RepID=A0A345YK53_9MICO|nr:SDR family NAD(P)-dependent oxidoreductase [Brachybacterium saurashtrense]AXK44305.1 SDR family NAD(P)-dependent oxidoreductase [Brachybacterium saurashtrense]RRR21341.1 SDR family NAD(P)-dependent oxidoreductase [Brachybacterium saurashtrense]RRR22916.1 SDR family NAD(P)-dependent oxidoreductase [Brachybacterium saurashtrense]
MDRPRARHGPRTPAAAPAAAPPLGWEHLPAPDLRGRRIVMTGASDGLGREAALQLARWGAELVLAVRTRTKGETVRARLVAETGREDAAQLVDLDLDDLSSVRAGAEEILRRCAPTGIDLLLHGAGLVTRRREETADGFERMLGVNALAPLLLTDLLLPAVRERVVVVTSHAHTFGRFVRDDPHFRRGGWSLRAGYGRSKLVTMLWGRELAAQLHESGTGVDLQLVHPGWVLTNLQNATGSARLDAMVTAASRPLAMPTVQGAAPVLLAATQPLPPGSYIGPDGRGALRGRPTLLRRSEAALDRDLAREVTDWAREEVTRARD